jgi:hypothetical protein
MGTASVWPYEIDMFVRSDADVSRARAAAEAAKVPYKVCLRHDLPYWIPAFAGTTR